MSTQQFLDLSSRQDVTPLIVAMHLNTWHVDGHFSAVAVWLRDEPEPFYFARESKDGAACIAWAKRHSDDAAFLMVQPWHIFATDAIAKTEVGFDRDLPVIQVHVCGLALPFAFPRESMAADMVRTWHPDEATEPRTKVLAAAS